MADFTSSLESPALRFAANEIIMKLEKSITKVAQFTSNFTAEAVTPGTVMLVPVIYDTEAQEFDRATNNYLTANGSLVYAPIEFKHHIKHSFGFTAKDFTLVNGTAFWSKSAEASTRALSRKIANVVFGMINKDTIKTSGKDYTVLKDKSGNVVIGGEGSPLEFSAANRKVVGTGAFTKATAASLRAACDAADIPVGDTILALNPVKFTELLNTLDAQLYGGPEAIRDGVVPNLYGFKAVVEVNEMPDGGDHQVGALIPSTAIAIASRILPVQNPQFYQEVGVTTDERSGLAIQLRRTGNAATDDSVATAECLFGVALIQPTKIVRLVTEEDESASASASASDDSSSSSSSSSAA